MSGGERAPPPSGADEPRAARRLAQLPTAVEILGVALVVAGVAVHRERA